MAGSREWLLTVTALDGREVYRRLCTTGDNAKAWAKGFIRDRGNSDASVVMLISSPTGRPWLRAFWEWPGYLSDSYKSSGVRLRWVAPAAGTEGGAQ